MHYREDPGPSHESVFDLPISAAAECFHPVNAVRCVSFPQLASEPDPLPPVQAGSSLFRFILFDWHERKLETEELLTQENR